MCSKTWQNAKKGHPLLHESGRGIKFSYSRLAITYLTPVPKTNLIDEGLII